MDQTALLFIELGVIYAGLSLLGLAARRVGLSPIPLFLLGGVAFGAGGITPVETAEPFVHVASEIGVIMLLLTLGLEFSPTELMSSMRRQRRSGLLDAVLNAPPGFIVGWLLGLPWPACLALAGVTWVSSSGIIARLLNDLGRLANRETPSVLSVLVLEDIAMAVYLPLLVAALRGGGPAQAAGGVALALGAVLAVMFMAYRYGDRLGRALHHEDDEQVLMRLVGLTLLVAGLAQMVGASAAVGAFVVGLAVPSEFAERAKRVLNPLRDLFASAFFVGFGLQVEPAHLLPVLPLAVALAVASTLTKVATGYLAAAHAGVAKRGRLRAGMALVARGEFSIVIAGLAVSAGFAEVGPVATAYVLILAVAGPVLARLAEPLGVRLFPAARPAPSPVNPPSTPTV